MKVKYIAQSNKELLTVRDYDENELLRNYDDLVIGKEYHVLGIEANDYRLLNKFGQPHLYPFPLFDIVDDSIPDDWVFKSGDEGEKYHAPELFLKPGFFEDYFDGKNSNTTIQTIHGQSEYRFKVLNSKKNYISFVGLPKNRKELGCKSSIATAIGLIPKST